MGKVLFFSAIYRRYLFLRKHILPLKGCVLQHEKNAFFSDSLLNISFLLRMPKRNSAPLPRGNTDRCFL